MTLRVERWGLGYAVFDGRKRISGVHSTRESALTRRDAIEGKSGGRERPCLRCGKKMVSSHAGHRMCGKCRDWCGAQDPQMAL